MFPSTAVPPAPHVNNGATASFQRLDRVQLSNGSVIIVTGFRPKATANPWFGVLENGKGKEYVFGPRHNPRKIGVVTESHPAIVANGQRATTRNQNPGVSNEYKLLVNKLCQHVRNGELGKATAMVEALEALDNG